MDIRTDVTLEMAEDMATTINACAHVDTSAKLPDKEKNGVSARCVRSQDDLEQHGG